MNVAKVVILGSSIDCTVLGPTMVGINQPQNQIKLSNISVVRLKRGGKRFEIACYKNKVSEWRKGVETDLDEVLQVQNVFQNVSKGQVSKAEDLKSAFGSTDLEAIIKTILQKGEVQLGEKERSHQLSLIHSEVAQKISSMTVDPESKRHYPVGIINKTLDELGFSFSINKSAKIQALDAIRLLQAKNIIPIRRAQMNIKITIASQQASKKIKEQISPLLQTNLDSYSDEHETVYVALIEPENYRDLDKIIRGIPKGKGSLEILDAAVVNDGEERY